MAENKQIGLGIRKIKQFAFAINEAFYRGDDSQMNIDFQQSIDVNKENELIIINFRVIYKYDDKPNDLVLDSHIQNVFQVASLGEYINDAGEVLLPENIWATFISLGISHSRAIIAENILGTALQNFLLPMMDPLKITKGFLEHPEQKIAKIKVD